MPRWVLLLVAMWSVLPLWAQDRPTYGVQPDGREVKSLAAPGTKAVVLFFVASDCPISNRTFPEMRRLRQEFTPRGVRFWFVYPNATEKPEEVQKHQAPYDSDGEAVLDVRGELARMSGATVTPEVSVFAPFGASEWRPVYTGRIDDRYVQIGVERPQPKEHFAENALNAILSGRPVETATGTPVGCSIVGSKAISRRGSSQ